MKNYAAPYASVLFLLEAFKAKHYLCVLSIVLNRPAPMKNFSILCFLFFLLIFAFVNKLEASEKEDVFTQDYKIYTTKQDRAIFEEYLAAFLPQNDLHFSDFLLKTARYFEGAPYVSSTLERDPEGLVLNLREFDCTTFVETVFALSQTLKQHGEQASFEHFSSHLHKLRYRGEGIQNYADRLHYLTDWIFENQNKASIKDITAELGGEPHSFNLFFMSKNAAKYPALKKHPELIPLMAAKEREISQRKSYAVLPIDKIDKASPLMSDGDIVCFVSNIAGLDVSHMGIVVKEAGRTSFIHASSSFNKVVIQPGSLKEYCLKSKRIVGVILLRGLWDDANGNQ